MKKRIVTSTHSRPINTTSFPLERIRSEPFIMTHDLQGFFFPTSKREGFLIISSKDDVEGKSYAFILTDSFHIHNC